MPHHFIPGHGPFEHHPGHHFGFGAAPMERRAMHHAWKQARREFHANLRDQADGHDGPFGSGHGPGHSHGHGPGFGPGPGPAFGFGPGGLVPGFGPGGPGRPGGAGPGGPRGWRRGGRGRGRRGDVRTAILVLLGEQPMHGYQMLQQIAERSNGLWRPSPGSVYPTLQLLVDEGLLMAHESDGSKKLFELTEEGRAAAEKVTTPPWEEIAEGVDPGHVNLQLAINQLLGALGQSAQVANTEQQQRIIEIVNNTRREIYGILGES